MRRYFFIIAAFFAVFTTAAIPVTASASAHATHSAITCTQKWTGFVGPPNPGNASVAWSSNPCGHQLRVHIVCGGGSFPATENGGWVRTVGLHSGATCPGAAPTLEQAFGQYRNGPGGTVTSVQFF